MDASALLELSHENFWYDRSRYEDAELEFQQYLIHQQRQPHCGASTGDRGCPSSKCSTSNTSSHKSSIVNEIAKAREHIKQSLNSQSCGGSTDSSPLTSRLTHLESENKQLRQMTSDLEAVIKRLESRVSVLEKSCSIQSSTVATGTDKKSVDTSSAAQLNGVADKDEDDDDFELFGDDNEEDDAEAERLKQERVKAYEDKKAKKPVLIAKSNIILDVKPWDDETDMVELEKCVRSIEMDGLLWGSSKLVPLAYTIKKLQISCVVEDDKVSVDDLEEKITAFEDYVQSIDIAAFNKI